MIARPSAIIEMIARCAEGTLRIAECMNALGVEHRRGASLAPVECAGNIFA
jgi:hypothetical protein